MTQDKARTEVKKLVADKGWTQPQAALQFNIALGTFRKFLSGRDANDINFKKITDRLGKVKKKPRKKTTNGVSKKKTKLDQVAWPDKPKTADQIKELQEQVAALTEEVSRLRQWKDTSFGPEDNWTPWDDTALMQ